MEASLFDFIAQPSFPCVMAKSVMSKGLVSQHQIETNDPDQAASEILDQMHDFVDHFRTDPKTLSSFIVSFESEELLEFGKFESFFWKLLETMDGLDKQLYQPDARVSNDPTSPEFSFSIKEEAFFMLVLHPQSPRMARRFAKPTIVFNAHQQFEDLREKGLFHKVRDLIRKRDAALQGFINPMVSDYGSSSEVYQYTGKVYPVQSKCPFQRAKALFKQIASV